MGNYWDEVKGDARVSESTDAGKILVPLNATLIKRAKVSAQWCWWIAGISAVNIFLGHFQVPVRFSVGLFFADIVYAIGHASGPVLTYVALAVDAVALSAFAVLADHAKRLRVWASSAAIVIMSIDTLLLVWLAGFQGIGAVVIHLVCIYFLFVGMQSARVYRQRLAAGDA